MTIRQADDFKLSISLQPGTYLEYLDVKVPYVHWSLLLDKGLNDEM